jgi:hypothetical protein
LFEDIRHGHRIIAFRPLPLYQFVAALHLPSAGTRPNWDQ